MSVFQDLDVHLTFKGMVINVLMTTQNAESTVEPSGLPNDLYDRVNKGSRMFCNPARKRVVNIKYLIFFYVNLLI